MPHPSFSMPGLTTVKAIILTRRIYNDFPKSTGLRVPKVTIPTYSQRSIGQFMYRFLYNNFYSRSYAEDVTSVTSGASQGPHSFNLVFVCLCVCLFVCVTPGAVPYLSRICDYKGSTGLYITAVHNICGLLYLSRTVPIFVVLCLRLPDVEWDLERNRETRRKLN